MVIFFSPQKEILISITNVFLEGFRDSGLEVRSVGTLEALIYMYIGNYLGMYVPLHYLSPTTNAIITYDLSLRTTQ